MSVGSVIHLSNYPKSQIMNKQSYHKPEFRLYGNISVMTQSMAEKQTASPDGGTATGMTKTS
jgi:hypothetical protein